MAKMLHESSNGALQDHVRQWEGQAGTVDELRRRVGAQRAECQELATAHRRAVRDSAALREQLAEVSGVAEGAARSKAASRREVRRPIAAVWLVACAAAATSRKEATTFSPGRHSE